ncbi:MAG TPA: hypothetical protein PLP89_02175 [Synergistales bacterium]|nr:hypothetical protein [Synergistales bacterium]HRV70428.1 hypothetical protein [Thermovirgaceae bacterium]
MISRMKKTASLLSVMFAIAVFFPASSHAQYLKILSVPGHPVNLVLEVSEGVITSALLRSPAGIQKILPIEGYVYSGENVVEPYADGDFRKDLLWSITLTRPGDRSRGIYLWIGVTTNTPRAWVIISPLGQTYWDSIPVKVYAPRGIGLFVSPNLPAYKDLPQFGGSRTLTFVYTIALTGEGPNFQVIPEVYRQLHKITAMVRDAEQIPERKEAYSLLLSDYESLSRGGKPSTEVIQNFTWKRILNLDWK